MSEMVEVAALAIAAEHAEMEPDDPYRFRRLAKAAIRSLREPTQAMVLAACAKANEEQIRPITIHRGDAVTVWQAMIDAMLQPDIETF